MDTLTELRGCAHRDNLYARALAIIDAQAADLRCYEKTMAMIALGQPAPRGDDALRVWEAARDTFHDTGNSRQCNDRAVAIIRAALASEEPTGEAYALDRPGDPSEDVWASWGVTGASDELTDAAKGD